MVGREEERRRRAREFANEEVVERGPPSGHEKCGAPTVDREGKPSGPCQLTAGTKTDHLGFGRCAAHGGNSVYENARGMWLMGHALGGELDVSPWDALLGTLRRAAARRAWWQAKVQELGEVADEEFLPGGQHHALLRELEKADDFEGKWASIAIKAGIAEKLVLATQVQAAEMFALMMQAIEPLGLTDEQMMTFRSTMRTGLLALEAGTIEGEVSE